VAEHWLVWPGCTPAGLQDTLTEVTVGDFVVEVKVPPVHPARHNAPKNKRQSVALRSIVLSALSRARTSAGKLADYSLQSTFAP
jgi:hypothetical protein